MFCCGIGRSENLCETKEDVPPVGLGVQIGRVLLE